MQTSGDYFPTILTRLQEIYQRIYTFVFRDLWWHDPTTFSSATRLLVRPLQVVLIVARGFFVDHQCLLRASALTYITLLAFVPLLAFMFAFLKGLGVQNLIEPWLIEEFSSVVAQENVRLIFDFVKNVKVGALSVISLGTLLFTTLWQLRSIERAMNEIWGVQGRTFLRKMTDYVSMIVIGPVVIVLALAAQTALQNQTLIATLLKTRLIGDAMTLAFTLLSYLAVWLGFAFLYAFIPNTRVRAVPALIGGFLGSMLWQLVKWGYIAFQIGMAKNEAIYGVFAQLPVLMFWFYISWVVYLLGAEVTFAYQNVAIYPFERFGSSASIYKKEWLACSLYFSLIQAFTAGTGPWSAVAFAQQHRMPLRLMREIVTTLASAKFLVETAEAPEHYMPSRDPSTITPWDILHALRHHGDQDTVRIDPGQSPATRLLVQIEEAGQQTAASHSMTQWLAEKDPTNKVS